MQAHMANAGVMVGVARRLEQGPIKDPETLNRSLTHANDFVTATATATAREDNVSRRLELATAAFSDNP
jgi:hypothetical protein